MKPDLRISIKDYRRNKSLKVTLARTPFAGRQFFVQMNGARWPARQESRRTSGLHSPLPCSHGTVTITGLLQPLGPAVPMARTRNAQRVALGNSFSTALARVTLVAAVQSVSAGLVQSWTSKLFPPRYLGGYDISVTLACESG